MKTFRGFDQLFLFDEQCKRKTLEFLAAGDPPNPRAVNIFAHLMAAERMWLSRLELGVNAPPPEPWPGKALDDLKKELDDVTGHWARYIGGLDEAKLAGKVSYITFKGDTANDAVSDILLQVILHSAYHRGQVTALAGGGEREAPSTDYIFFVR